MIFALLLAGEGVATVGAAILAAEGSSSTDPIGQLLRYGPVGILAALFVLGLAYGKPTVDRLIKERDQEREYNRTLESELRRDIIPLLRDVQTTTAEATKGLASSTATLSEAIRVIGEFRMDLRSQGAREKS